MSEPIYRLFGLEVASAYPFKNNIARVDGCAARLPASVNIMFSCSENAPFAIDRQGLSRVYDSAAYGHAAGGRFSLYHDADFDLARCFGAVDFYLRGNRIDAHLRDVERAYYVEIALLGSIFAYWFERRGWPVLHASAVAIDEQAVAFLAQNKGGKTSLAASLMQTGSPLLSDDMIPLEPRDKARSGSSYWLQPGYPTMRMWPELANYFIGHHQTLDMVHPHYSKRRVPVGPSGFGLFCPYPTPLRCIYLPRRQVSQNFSVNFEPLTPRQALIELVRHSFIPRLVHAAGWQQQRLKLLRQLVEAIPVRRINYSDGLVDLPRVREHILKDLKAL